MFERIKCYRKTKKMDEFLHGCEMLAELTQDKSELQEVKHTLEMNAYIRKHMWFNRKLAVDYNRECVLRGF